MFSISVLRAHPYCHRWHREPFPQVSYEERVQRREEEIQSLKEALEILDGTDVDI